MSVLDKINSLDDLRQLGEDELPDLATDIRKQIIDVVSNNGGHLASNLGAVELTIALLRVFSPPKDKILFDVSHQAYTYKILTDRKEDFATLRKTNGISGFLKPTESKFDAFSAGHAGTSISAGIGFAAARDLQKSDNNVVAVIGDGSISNGVSLEAINNVANTTKRFIIVLNDNNMSISENVGALSKMLGRVLVSRRYNKYKRFVERIFIKHFRLGFLSNFYHRIESLLKSIFVNNSIIENMGIRYVGPVDGHNIKHLIAAFEVASNSEVPVLVHVHTQKGRGYKYAEQHPELWHGPAPFDIETGKSKGAPKPGMSWSNVFSESICRLAKNNKRIVAITAAMAEGTGLVKFSKEYPERFYDVGISEEHQMTFAAGLAAGGMHPVVAVYSTFYQRAIDGFIHDVALQKLPVVVCLDRAGAVPGDGPTHHGVFDIALSRMIPNVLIMQPRLAKDLVCMLHLAMTLPYPVIIRYPRGNSIDTPTFADEEFSAPLAVGKANELDRFNGGESQIKVSLWSLGNTDTVSAKVGDILKASNISFIRTDARFVVPLDTEKIDVELQQGVRLFVTFEDGVSVGGFGSAFEECVQDRAKVIRIGWDNPFISHASSLDDLYKIAGNTPEKIAERILNSL